ncbi:MAG: universal stress protein [Deltaproteobacteria bacterium]
MIEYKNVLFCTDFSEDANIAFLHALDLARKHGAKLHILHVPHSSYAYCRHIVDEHIPEGSPGGEAFYNEEIEKAAEKALRETYDHGSTVANVSKYAHCHVIAIRNPAKQFTLPGSMY